jgi:hypothetical protein
VPAQKRKPSGQGPKGFQIFYGKCSANFMFNYPRVMCPHPNRVSKKVKHISGKFYDRFFTIKKVLGAAVWRDLPDVA